jgi:hypothetical protein
MAKYALLDGNEITQVLVADNEDGLGVMGQLFETIDITHITPQPSKGWTYEGGVFYPARLQPSAKALWDGTTFTNSEIIDAEVVEEAPAVEAPTTTRKKK